jgi:protein-disulfide isomerase
MRRRDLLRATGAGALAAAAGCTSLTGGGGSSGLGENSGPPPEHEATAGIESQPVNGDLGGTMIVAFEDPSCTRCAAFESETVPKIESNLVEPGKAAFAFRGYPVVYPWGDPGTHALEAAYEASEDAFWALKDHYFANQGDFSEGNVYDRTKQFLNSETDVDGQAVVDAASAGEFESAVQSDLDAGMAAGAGQTTPHVFLFKNGEYLTKAQGSVSYDLIASALGA